MVPVVAEAEFIGQRGSEDVRLAEHEVLREDEVPLAAVSAAIEDGSKRKSVQDDVVQVAVTCIGLVLGADIPVQTLIPLDRVVGLRDVLYQVAVGLAAVGIRRGIQIENLLRDRIDLVSAEDVRLTVTCERPCWVAGIRLIESDRLRLAGEIGIEQLGEGA